MEIQRREKQKSLGSKVARGVKKFIDEAPQRKGEKEKKQTLKLQSEVKQLQLQVKKEKLLAQIRKSKGKSPGRNEFGIGSLGFGLSEQPVQQKPKQGQRKKPPRRKKPPQMFDLTEDFPL